jgi:hypothetical protein
MSEPTAKELQDTLDQLAWLQAEADKKRQAAKPRPQLEAPK